MKRKIKKIMTGQELYDSIDKDVEYDEEDLRLLEEMKNSNFTSMEEENPKAFEEYKKKLQKAAKEYKQSKKLVSIRLARHDIDKVKKMAEEEGVPYQTLLSAIIHKVANGKIEINVKC